MGEGKVSARAAPVRTSIRPGDVIAGRFQVERHAGSGGMGDVYRGRDLESGQPIALKLLHAPTPELLDRFSREAKALELARLPGVVEYVAHGVTEDGQPYLAMEWLTGETLSQRLAGGPLTVAETLTLASRVAGTLGAVHRLGIVHRDLKPSNLLIVGGDLERVTLIDFGVVRMGNGNHATMPGDILGTPGYMAPEQVRGQLQIDARVDVYALGCVLFKCLTGRAAFDGALGLAVLAKVLVEPPPRARELRPGIPAWLDGLVARMLSKSPEHRPRDGDAVAAELVAQRSPAELAVAPSIQGSAVEQITSDERKVMCLVLALDGSSPVTVEETVSEQELFRRTSALRAIATRYEGTLELIEARSPLLVLSGGGAPSDLAARAASCALVLQRLLHGAPVAMVTGRAELAGSVPVGALIDRAAQLLPAAREPACAVAVRVDEVTASLLSARFVTTQDEAGRWLWGGRDAMNAAPQLLGKPTPFLGRNRELKLLQAELQHCLEEPAATAVLITGPPGIGKSRLCHEFLVRAQGAGEAMQVWIGKGDPMSAGSAFGLLSGALRHGIGIVDGEAIEVRRRKVLARVERSAGLDAERVAAFLGELVGAPFPEEADVQLQAARRSPMLMGDQVRLAWEEFLREECAARPVLLVLEDLHWGDLPTVTMIDAALRNLKDRPWMVLALCRPEVHTLFPKLWQGRRGHEIRLTPLTRKASEQLVKEALGDAVSPDLLATLVQRADGNAFYLEEQIRAASQTSTAALPETVLAMVQMELAALSPAARRVLRAASIFGESFSRDGVAALVGGADPTAELEELLQREVVQDRERAASGERAYRFRHALVREAAYGMLTQRDLELGHALAGRWIEQLGDADPMALAEHFERGAEPSRAAAAYLRAAQQALQGSDLTGAIARADRGIVCGPEPAITGALRLVQADAHRWRGEYALAEQRANEAASCLAPGSRPWFSAIGQAVVAAGRLGGVDRVASWVSAARDTAASEDAVIAKHACLATVAAELALGGRYEAADALIGLLEAAIAEPSLRDHEVVARLERARSIRATVTHDVSTALHHQRAALAAFDQLGDRRTGCVIRTNIGFFCSQLGDLDAGDGALDAALAAAEQMELPAVVASVHQNRGLILCYRGHLEAARAAVEQAIATFQQMRNPRMEGGSRTYLASVLLRAGDLAGAEREALAAADLLQSAPPLRAQAIAVLADVRLAQERADDALARAIEARTVLESSGVEEGESLIRRVHAEALLASGRTSEALTALASARDALLSRAARIPDPARRERFLSAVPDNARTVALARRHLGEGAA